MRRADFLAGVGLLVFAALYYQQTFAIRVGFASDRLGPAFFPRLLAFALAALAAVLIVRAASGNSDPAAPPALRVPLFLGTLALCVGYGLAMPYLGFVIATPILLGLLIGFLGLREPGRLVLTSVGVTAILYLVFARALHVLLPAGFLRF